MRTPAPTMVTLGEAIAATALSGADLLAWVNAGILPVLELDRDGTPRWPAEVIELIMQIDGFLELDLQLDDLRGLLPFAVPSPSHP